MRTARPSLALLYLFAVLVGNIACKSSGSDWLEANLIAEAKIEARVLGVSVASAKVSTKYRAANINTKLSYSFNTDFVIEKRTLYITDFRPAADVKNLVDDINQLSLAQRQTPSAGIKGELTRKQLEFFLRCGDRFVSQVALGSQFSTAVRIHFRENRQLLDFMVNAEAKIGGIKKKQNETESYDRSMTDSVVETAFLQLGGKQENFTTLQKSLGGEEPTSVGSKRVRCFIDAFDFEESEDFKSKVTKQLERCYTTWGIVNQYLAGSYFNQMHTATNEELVSLKQHYLSYAAAGILNEEIVLPADVKKILATLNEMLRILAKLDLLTDNTELSDVRTQLAIQANEKWRSVNELYKKSLVTLKADEALIKEQIKQCVATCKTTSNSTSKPKDFVAANGRKKVLFEGYNDNSKQYVNRVCIAPTFALNNKTVRPEYLMPEIFSLVPDTEVGKILKTINDSAKALGVAMDPMKINSYSGSDQEASIEYIKDAEGTTLLDKVAGGLNVSMNFAGGSASGGAQIALENGKTSRSLSQMFLLKLRGQSVQIDPQTVSAAWGLTAYGESVRDSVSKILGDDAQVQYVAQHCGTSYISSVQFGATFLASLKIIGKMESDLTYIQGQLNVKTVGASGGGQVEIDNKKISSNMKVNLNIYQKGGEPVSLAGIFNGGGFDANGTANTLARDTTSSKLVNCDVGTLSNCLDVFFRIVEYGTGGLPIDVNGDPKVGTKTGISPKLAAQISDVTRSGYSVIGYEKERYYVEDFVTAGMFTNPPAGMQLRARAAPKKSSMGFKLAQAAANKKPMPLSSRTLQKSLEMRLRSIINIWAYASESRQIVNDLT
ncbi:MAG: hypothetical protein NTX25_16280, partial [Proteobacteria bacterium]|nr:hypothetical protein [Pseudomonadota bacterium]